MQITLHDNIHPSAGPYHPAARPSLGDASRAAWVRAMHGLLQKAAVDGGSIATGFDVDVGTLRVRARTHGTALSAFWSAGSDDCLVAASVLLRGDDASDDAALRAIRDHDPRLPFGGADYAALAAEIRPCLATLYLDARWYDNARVELAATALALAAIHGPEGRLSMQGDAPAAQLTPPPAGPFSVVRHDGLKFNFTRERLRLIMGLVAKKGSAAIDGRRGVHFRVYPPRQFLERPGVLRGRDIFGKLAATDWCVLWYDGRCDRLGFGELLGFLDQTVEAEKAFATTAGHDAPAPPPALNTSVWSSPPAGDAGTRRPVRVKGTVDVRELVRDATIRRLFDSLGLEPAPLPPRTAEPVV